MRKLAVLIIGLVGVFGLSGCGSNYKCDNKESAESALNLLLFEKATGSGNKDLTYQSLGFEISDDIMLSKLDKANKQSMCKVQVGNKILTQFAIDFQNQNTEALGAREKNIENNEYLQRVIGEVAFKMRDPAIIYLASDFYKAIYKNNEQVDFNEAQIIVGIAIMAAKIVENGISYRVYDNGNGDIMINVDKVI